MADDDRATVSELLKGQRLGMLTTTAPDGTLTSRPMALQDVEFDGDVWLFAESESSAVEHIAAHPQVNLAVGSGSTWISLTGEASTVDDTARKKELWNAGVDAWLPEGPESPTVALIKVDASSAQYWDTPGGRVATALSFAKAKVTGERAEIGESEKVDL